ncbi:RIBONUCLEASE P SUBUNIT P29 [Salix viminalis]|uniref:RIBONUCLEASE P SUBUNIT P29 n=1 Tax=Salix viminalis TaxID=40686 RepID=A0A9Q0TLQ4_SALVM|nr:RIBONUCLEASE P SUBUNIT P29 [Salix viminalis]KAJ6713917.1 RIBONUCLEASE P SUBUNIT P29 [Salix viminalis]
MATDQRKRTMDALERRFAVAKAELVQQQQKKHKVTHHEGHRKENNNAASTSLHRADAPKTPSSSLSKKGSLFFFGYTPSQDPDENGLAYSQLPQAVHENLLTTGVKFESKKGSVVDKILHDLFQHGDASQKYMQGSRNIKIDNWILLDNYVPSKSTGSQTTASRSNSKHSRRHMSMKQHKKFGMFNLPQDLQKFDVYKPMHEIWKDYMTQLLKKTGQNELPKCLLSADLHGAAILVADCKIKSFTGVRGIMIRETAETFGIITQDNKLKVVPKKVSVFIFQIDCWKITMLGDKLSSRNSGL